MIKILLADDHPIIIKGLKQIIEEEDDMKVTGEAKNGNEALDLMRKNDYDIAILDITMPKKTGVEVIEEMKYLKKKIPVLVLSVHPEDQFAMRVLKTGAKGYMTKESAPENIVDAIKKIINGGKYISPTLAEKILSDINSDRDEAPHETLSNREFQIIVMIASGKTLKEIAEELNLNIKTISTYRQRILEKMNMTSNSELTRYVLDNRLMN
jgi:DNA-binding NarL/FixJ family response regulator